MSHITTALITVVLAYLTTSCGRNQNQVDTLPSSRLASISIKTPIDKDGALKAGVDYDSAEVLFRTTEDNAKWESKGTLKLDGKNDAMEKSLSFKPGTYVLNMKLIDSKTKKVVAEASGDNAECTTPKVTLKAGENEPIALKLCLTDDASVQTATDADVVLSPEVVASEKSVLTAEGTTGDFSATGANVDFSLSNITNGMQVCDSKVVWNLTLIGADDKETKKTIDKVGKSAQVINANSMIAQNFETLPEDFKGRISKVEVDIQVKCKNNKAFVSLQKGTLTARTTASAK